MSDIRSSASLEEQVGVTLSIIPIEEEEDDLDTLAVAGQMHIDVQQELTQTEGYTVRQLIGDEEAKTRSIDLVLLITVVGAAVAAYKDLLTSIFQMIAAIVEVLAKRGHVGEMEIIVDGKTLILRDVNKKTAQELITAFQIQYPETAAQLCQKPTVTVNAKVSKRKRKKAH